LGEEGPRRGKIGNMDKNKQRRAGEKTSPERGELHRFLEKGLGLGGRGGEGASWGKKRGEKKSKIFGKEKLQMGGGMVSKNSGGRQNEEDNIGLRGKTGGQNDGGRGKKK